MFYVFVGYLQLKSPICIFVGKLSMLDGGSCFEKGIVKGYDVALRTIVGRDLFD